MMHIILGILHLFSSLFKIRETCPCSFIVTVENIEQALLSVVFAAFPFCSLA